MTAREPLQQGFRYESLLEKLDYRLDVLFFPGITESSVISRLSLLDSRI